MVQPKEPSSAREQDIGYILSHPPPGEEVVVSGISGYFPESDSVLELQENLFNKTDMVTEDPRRFDLFDPDLPQRGGRLKQIDRFDHAFFSVSPHQVTTMEPPCRIVLERTFEALIDAGINPKELRNTKTAVYVGASFSETENECLYMNPCINGSAVTGCSRAMLANQISHFFHLRGPSCIVDSACSSSLIAIANAYNAIRSGYCEAALVCGVSITLHPYLTMSFYKLGVLSKDGKCKSFDRDANGYVRGETVSVCLLQKAKDAKRVYMQVAHAKTNCDGYKPEGITYPSREKQRQLLTEFYDECGVGPQELEFIEAHGTGTRVGDPEELNAMDDCICSFRTEPLLIGSVKSNLGHSEPASGMGSLAKMCIAYRTGYLAPNLNYENPRDDVPALVEGRLVVLTEKTPWKCGLSGISNFGFGGANAHILLKNFAKKKINQGVPIDGIPRLVFASGRTVSAVEKMLGDLCTRPLDVEHVALLHSVYKHHIPGHDYRGYALLEYKKGKTNCIDSNVEQFHSERRPLWFVFSGLGTEWDGMATNFMKIPAFKAAIDKCHEILQPKGLDVRSMVTIERIAPRDPALGLVGVVAMQVAFCDVMESLDIMPDFIVGYGLGELACGYADKCLTLEQVMLCTYTIARAVIDGCLDVGCMVQLSLGQQLVRKLCPPDVYIAAHNSSDSCVIAGPPYVTGEFVSRLSAEGVRAMPLSCYSVPFHTPHVDDIAPRVFKQLMEIIPEPKERSNRWISTSTPKEEWEKISLSSAEYHINSLLSPILFHQILACMPWNAITLEISPHPCLQDILDYSLREHCTNLTVSDKDYPNNLEHFLVSMGRLYEAGPIPKMHNIFKKVSFPVSVETPMLSHLVEWNHKTKWPIMRHNCQKKIDKSETRIVVSLKDAEYEFLSGHILEDRNLYPATGYLYLAWYIFGLLYGQLHPSVVFENVRFRRACSLHRDTHLSFTVIICKGSGNFEIVENDVEVVSGKITQQNFTASSDYPEPEPKNADDEQDVCTLNTKDFYKEMRLRGYNYTSLFRGVLSCDLDGKRGTLAWRHNWVTFLDTMMQIKIFGVDTRELFVPTRIDRLSIDTDRHYKDSHIMSEEQDYKFDVVLRDEMDTISAGGVEISGLHAAVISRRKNLAEAVLEKYVFVPHFEKAIMKMKDIMRVNVQIVLENIQGIKIRVIEVPEKNVNLEDGVLVSPIIRDVLGDMPLLQADILVVSDEKLDLGPNITVENKKFAEEHNAMIFVGSNLLEDEQALEQGLGTLKPKGFILTREKDISGISGTEKYSTKYDFITCFSTETEHLVLLRKKLESKQTKYIEVKFSDDRFEWIEKIKSELSQSSKLVLVSQKETLNGILGLVNCLRREPGGEVVYCLMIDDDDAPDFDPELPMYWNQLEKNLIINVYRNGEWGTYRHLQLESEGHVRVVPRAGLAMQTRGDLTSFQWVEMPVLKTPSPGFNMEPVNVYYSALNFLDVMTATGRLTVDVLARGRLNKDCAHGLEFCGKTDSGDRVMGISPHGALTNHLLAPKDLLWRVPDRWSLEEACTVPVVYGTVLYGFYKSGGLKTGSSVLIHAGSGGVGQAAIHICLYHKCTIFTTVGTKEKREFIKATFPQIKDSHIGNSRDVSFEEMVMTETRGAGVDIVLNSLADDKLQASLRCVGREGRFLEIGKYDFQVNSTLGMHYFLDGRTFHSIMLDNLMINSTMEDKQNLNRIVTEGMENGSIQPLCRIVFNPTEVEQAFRHMAGGKHIGKVLIQIREEESNRLAIPEPLTMTAMPRYICGAGAYVVVGGLGGFGLELADRLVLRGARVLVLNTRRGLTNGYQAFRVKTWRKYGVTVHISMDDVSTERGCASMLRAANALAPVHAIYNLAVLLHDALFENQTAETFAKSFAPKVDITNNLDLFSREMCPHLKQFVVFSSVSCGRGNAGQSNYGAANSVMERACERRRQLGLPALAVQWGAVGEVGLVADMQEEHRALEIGGTLQQKIQSCLDVLEQLELMHHDSPVVSSMVVAEKKISKSGCGNVVDAVLAIMGMKDIKLISQTTPISELGMDSMMAVEIKQCLEREFEIFLSAQEIRSLTFGRLIEVSAAKENESEEKSSGLGVRDPGEVDSLVGLPLLLGKLVDEEEASLPTIYPDTAISIGTQKQTSGEDRTVVFVPGVEGVGTPLLPLCRRVRARAAVLQLGHAHVGETIVDIANRLYKTISEEVTRTNKPFLIVGYSYGAIISLEVARLLEEQGLTGTLVCIDGAPQYLYSMLTANADIINENNFETSVFLLLVDMVSLKATVHRDIVMKEFEDIIGFDNKVKMFLTHVPPGVKHSKEYLRSVMTVVYDRMKSVRAYNVEENNVTKLKSRIVLLKATEKLINVKVNNDYDLQMFSEIPVTVFNVEGNHTSILENKDCGNIINNILHNINSIVT